MTGEPIPIMISEVSLGTALRIAAWSASIAASRRGGAAAGAANASDRRAGKLVGAATSGRCPGAEVFRNASRARVVWLALALLGGGQRTPRANPQRGAHR